MSNRINAMENLIEWRAAHPGIHRTSSIKGGRSVQTRPEFKRGEGHINAKFWSFRDPEGEVHKFVNLLHFIREHPDLFEPKDRIVRHGQCKASKCLGELNPARRRHNQTWKGWSWYYDTP
jgi:hypothetical protein